MSGKKFTGFVSLVLLLVVFTFLYSLPTFVLPIFCMAIAIALFGYITTQFHYKYVALAGISIFFVFFTLSQNPYAAILTALPFLLCGLTLGVCYNLKLPPVITLRTFTTLYALTLVLGMKQGSANGETAFTEVLTSAAEIYKEALTQSFGAELSAAEINGIVTELTSEILRFFPAFVVIGSVLVAMLSFYLFKRVCMLLKADVSSLTNFSTWRAEKGVSIIYFILLLVSLFAPGDSLFADVVLNIVVVMMFVFFLLGIALLEHLLAKKIKKSAIRKLILVAVTIFTLPFFGLSFFVLSFAGALDGVMDYRQKKFFRR